MFEGCSSFFSSFAREPMVVNIDTIVIILLHLLYICLSLHRILIDLLVHWHLFIPGNGTGGSRLVAESKLTGESLPVAKEKGCPVFSGTVNWVCTCT